MAKDIGTVWDLEPHTAAKHAILRRYLQAWIPILSSAHGRVVYIDGFAGPGVYSRGEDGSPIIALKSALEHAQRIKGEIVFLFIELDPERKASLELPRDLSTAHQPLRRMQHYLLDRCCIDLLIGRENRALIPPGLEPSRG